MLPLRSTSGEQVIVLFQLLIVAVRTQSKVGRRTGAALARILRNLALWSLFWWVLNRAFRFSLRSRACGDKAELTLAPAPMMPLKLFVIRNFGWGNIATALIYGALNLGFFVLGALPAAGCRNGCHRRRVGFAALHSDPARVLSAGRGTFRTLRSTVVHDGGSAPCAAGFLMLLGVGLPLNYFVQVLPAMLMLGIGLTVTVAPLTSAVLAAVDPAKAGIRSAVNNTVARIKPEDRWHARLLTIYWCIAAA